MTQRERLIKLLKEWGTANTDSVPEDKIADYLLVNGVIVPPCKVGDTVYFAEWNIADNGDEYFKYIHKGYVVSWTAQNDGLWAYCLYDDGLTEYHKVKDDFGKTVFLTREEAGAS